MQLTTPQLYALAVMAVLTIIVIGISYVSGLRTGRAAGKTDGYDDGVLAAEKRHTPIVAAIREQHALDVAHLQDQISMAQGHYAQASAEASEHARKLALEARLTERLDEMIKRLMPKAFHSEDLLTLNLADRQLGITAKAHARTGTNKPNQAQLAQLAQQALKEIVARVSAAGPDVAHPDTELLDWLQKHGTFTSGVATAHIRFPFLPIELGAKSFRDLIKHAQAVTPAEPARDEDGYLIPAPIAYIGDGKDTWQRTDEEQSALGRPAAQCL